LPFPLEPKPKPSRLASYEPPQAAQLIEHGRWRRSPALRASGGGGIRTHSRGAARLRHDRSLVSASHGPGRTAGFGGGLLTSKGLVRALWALTRPGNVRFG